MLALAAVVVPPRLARALLVLVVLTLLADVALAFIHVGVEAHWWPSPLPECAAPRFVGGSIAERLASMPAHPAKPCDDPSYLIPGLPVSLAMMNLLFALAFAVGARHLPLAQRQEAGMTATRSDLPGDRSPGRR